MVLVDTSIWVSHLRSKNPDLAALLHDGEVMCHPFIIGELACGHLSNRDEILLLLHALPAARVATHGETITFIETHRLMGIGLGLSDVHLLAAALLSRVPLWTSDKALQSASARLGIYYV